jgi:hypothetical protein
VDAVECKINPDRLDVALLKAFRGIYPSGANYVVSPLVKTSYVRELQGLRITYCDIAGLKLGTVTAIP